MMGPFDDLHQHVLWGLDDGAPDPQTTFSMLRHAKREGVGLIIATPHVQPGLRSFDHSLYDQRLGEARAFCAQENLDLALLPGAEISYTSLTGDLLRDGRVPTLAGTEYILLEFWPDVSWRQVTEAVESLTRRGFIPVLAHVERYRCFCRFPRRAVRLREDMQICYQVNCNALLHPHGFFAPRFLRFLLDERAADALATDAHDCRLRPPGMRAAYDFVCKQCDREYADALTSFVRNHLLRDTDAPGLAALRERKASCGPPPIS